jgi:hypothetical protein
MLFTKVTTLNSTTMASTSEDPLFYTVLEAVQRIVTSIEYGLQFNEDDIEIEEPAGYHFKLPRQQWLGELRVAVKFFEENEYYEDCARCVRAIEQLEAEPTIEQIIRQVSDHAQPKNDD